LQYGIRDSVKVIIEAVFFRRMPLFLSGIRHQQSKSLIANVALKNLETQMKIPIKSLTSVNACPV